MFEGRIGIHGLSENPARAGNPACTLQQRPSESVRLRKFPKIEPGSSGDTLLNFLIAVRYIYAHRTSLGEICGHNEINETADKKALTSGDLVF